MNRKLIATGLAILTLTGCQNQEELADAPESAKTYVLADLALSLPANSARTRMTTGVVQAGGSSFRGIQRLSIIPFSKQGTIIGADMPSYYEFASDISSDPTNGWYAATSEDVKQRFRLFDKVYLTHGTASFLVYGQATAADGGKPANGSLIANVSGQTPASVLPDRVAVAPSNITFELEPIYNSTVAPAAAQSIASILSAIANTSVVKDDKTTLTWKDGGAAGSSNSNDWLKETYKLFINQNGETECSIIAGSKRSVTEYVDSLKSRMKAAKFSFSDDSDAESVITEILAQIAAAETGLGSLSVVDIADLPDGALALQWDLRESRFEAKTVTSLTTPINAISRFAYPPELYYRVNSLIRTSNSEVDKEVAYKDKTDWNTILTTSYKDGTVVSGNTKAVAITDPLQYAVAHLSATVQATSTLEDADHRTITVENESFPVTGIIVCGQHTVDFEFKPLTALGEERFVYDSQLGTSVYMTAGSPSTTFHTLLLQSLDKKAGSDVGDVTIALELENNSGQNFHGEDGIIYKDTRFYLMGKITPDAGRTDATGEESTDVKKRVFTQDHTTVVNMKVSSLAHAYNVLPNILAGQLAIGVDMELDWRQTTPTVIQLTD